MGGLKNKKRHKEESRLLTEIKDYLKLQDSLSNKYNKGNWAELYKLKIKYEHIIRNKIEYKLESGEKTTSKITISSIRLTDNSDLINKVLTDFYENLCV